LSEGLKPLHEFFEIQKQKGNIRSQIDTNDLAILCASLLKGLLKNIANGMDSPEAKRIWLIGFSHLTNYNQRENPVSASGPDTP